MMRVLFLLLLLLPSLALADEPQLRGEYQKWLVYGYHENGAPVCYAMTRAIETKNAKGKPLKIKDRGQVLFQVTRRVAEGDNAVVSYVAGHTIKSKTPVMVRMDKAHFQLRGDGDTAWTETTATDALIVKALRANKDLTVTHQDRKGNAVGDAFSLKGASVAIDAIAKCD